MKELNFELLGDRILVKLDEAVDHTITESGIMLPLTKPVETDGGRISTELSKQRHLGQGTIIQMGSLAVKKLQENLSDINIGDRVFVSPQVFNSKSYEFSVERNNLLSEFDGYVCIPHILIEAKINA